MKREETLELYKHYEQGLSLAQVCNFYAKGLSRQALHERFKRMNLELRPKQASNASRTFKGKTYGYSSKDNCWRSTTGERTVLARDMWKDSYGELSSDKIVHVAEGHRMDYTLKHLTLVDKGSFISRLNSGVNQFSSYKCECCGREFRIKMFKRKNSRMHKVCLSCFNKAMQS